MRYPSTILVVAACLALGLACARTTSENNTNRAKEDSTVEQGSNQSMNPCRDAFTTIEKRDWASWAGLPDSCTLTDVADHFPQLSDGNGRANLGEDTIPAEFKTIAHPDFKKPIRVWYRDGRVIMLELEYPGVDDGHRVLSDIFGDPAARLDYHQRTLLYQESAYVYPDRGIAILYNPDRSAVIRMYFFATTTLDAYRKGLHHPVRPARRLPAKVRRTP